MANRYYKTGPDGKRSRVPGVTTIISSQIGWNKNGLLYWANKKGLEGLSLEEARQEATGIGTRAHQLIEADIRGREPPLCDWMTPDDEVKVETCMAAWRAWRMASKLEVTHIERELTSSRWDVGGRVDVIGKIGDQSVILDWKSSNAIYSETLLQVAAYARIWMDESGEQIDSCHVVRIGKNDGSFHHHSWTMRSLAAAVDAFDAACQMKALKKRIDALI
jgi:hypothetical protein